MVVHKHVAPSTGVVEAPPKTIDAGLKELDHYKQRLPPWRYAIRERLIPIVRWETPHLAAFQTAFRTPMLDSYFAWTANLGTHTFFMAALPICYWCGYPTIGMALVLMLAAGVCISDFCKDLLCLPRPLSPPLQRITMSGSAALEYGFPSTHTTNAVSVAIFCLYQLELAKDGLSAGVYYAYMALFWTYAISISVGRIYCGMHGFLDVFVGALLGAFIAWVRIAYGTIFDHWIVSGDISHPLIVSALLLLAVRFHPEPADDCPCFEDSVAFLGVVLGIEFGAWSWRQHGTGFSELTRLDDMYPYKNDVLKAIARVVGGIAMVFMWRALMKPVLLSSLPPIFRFVDHWGLRLPRRFFLQARHYGKVPPLPKDDNVLPPASKIPSMLKTLPNVRKRTVSVGPQSEADVREFIANRDQQRRNSRSDSTTKRPDLGRLDSAFNTSSSAIISSPMEEPGLPQADQSSPKVKHSNGIPIPSIAIDTAEEGSKEEEQANQRMFDALEPPRVRYDVEVITKLVVYAGIAWLVTEGNPTLFVWFGVA